MIWPFRSTARTPQTRAVEREDFFGRPRLDALPTVNHEDAARMSAVFCACRLVAEAIGSLPCHVVEHTDDGERKIADHWLARLLDEPNPAMSRPEFFETIVSQFELRGNHYSEVIRDGSGRPVALWPLRPNIVRPERKGASLIYHVNTRDGVREVGPDRILHLRIGVMSPDGICGADPVALLSHDLAVGAAARNHAARFFQNAAQPGGVLRHPAELSPEAAERLRAQFDARYGGADAHRTMLLEQGMEWQALSFDNEKSQMMEARVFAIQDVARVWNLPAHKLMDNSRSTFNNLEQLERSYVQNSLRPRIVRLEHALNRQLLSVPERARYSVQFGLDGLLRGSTTERYSAYSTAIQNGFMSRAEVRRLEDLPRVDGLDEMVMMPGAATVAAGDGNEQGADADATENDE